MVEPLNHKPQTQPLTVALKNICRDYPAGGGVLRELLQNADDAGASSVRFVLDEKYYATDTIVDPGLADYQGPSLLAYNDATFSDKDFDSLSRIGDSGKLQDSSTTGRFGRGFNAVFNWTDSPSIVSRDRLLILDPHHWWTKRFEDRGGPIYDFVANAKGGKIKDQMAAFSGITTNVERAFEGTIIRIPLRTLEQAKVSKICNREATFSEVAQVLDSFSHEFGHTGLLFMKNVSRISIKVGDKPPSSICISNEEQVRKYKSEINANIRRRASEDEVSFNSSFEIEIKAGVAHHEQKYRFAIHHSIQNYPEDSSLKSWSKSEALLPWVALASEIGGSSSSKSAGGSLFNVLPSQIHINQPILIHSCFSMSPDRARLHRTGDGSVQYPLPGLWNQWLFDELIPTAWTNLLVFLAQKYPHQSAFKFWPISQENSNEISYGLDKKVLQIVEQNNYPIWHTDLGYVALRSGLVSKSQNQSDIQQSLNEAGVPVIYLADSLRSSVESVCTVVHLNPATLCGCLERRREQLQTVGDDSKQALLEYVISDPEFRGYGAVELFPFEDGSYKAINIHTAFIHRDEDERLLFQLESSRNVDLRKLSQNSVLFLRRGCSTGLLHASLRQRSPVDLRKYCLQNQFKPFRSNEETIPADETVKTFISAIWDWIVARQHSILDENICTLWLVPLTDGKYRKVRSANASFTTIFTAPGDLGEFLRSLAKIAVASNKPIIEASKLSAPSLLLLTHGANKDPSLLIKSSDNLEDFVTWLGGIQGVFDVATDKDKLSLHKLLADRLSTCGYRRTILNVLRGLKIFQRVVWNAENDHMVPRQTWVTLREHSNLFGLRELNPIPDLGGATFLSAICDDTSRLLAHFELVMFPSPLVLLERFMIPFWGDKVMLNNWTTSGKEKVTESLLRDFFNLDLDSRKRVMSSSLIPVKRFDGKGATKFSKAGDLIDPSNKKLRGLFFEDEEACVVDWAREKYTGILTSCGLRTALDGDLVVQRIKCFAQRTTAVTETTKRARSLLRSFPSWVAGPDANESSTIRELRWLPAVDLDGSRTFKDARECRSQEEKSLVGYVLPLLDFRISEDWSARLGWNQPIHHAKIINQLRLGIEKNDLIVVNVVLKYIKAKGQIEDVRQELMDLSCVVASKGDLVGTQKAFRTGCERLQPYFYNVDRSFWLEHTLLLKDLGVKDKPDLKDLLKIQDQLSSKGQLDESDIYIAVEICKLASVVRNGDRSSFKILDETGTLQAVTDVVFNDLGSSTITGTFHSTHADIPKTVIEAFRIEPLSARVKRGELGIADTDDDEFDQHQDVAAAISDILSRYKVESTFSEFLANADDCKDATVLNWLLDNREHPKTHLLTADLKQFQGPALLVHNNAVFRDEDFEGLRRVGRGGKENDDSTIGKFGRGSQTMYHWTDVPMLLSGKYLIILDPLRQVLDYNYRTGRRKPGVKIELSKLKGAYRDHLTPFAGLWGFSLESDYYPETIFRFPLRSANTISQLMKTRTPLDFEATRKCLDRFIDEDGRISLLFLSRIQFMDFQVYGDKESRWSIKTDEKELSFLNWVKCIITKRMDQKLDGTFQDRWRVAVQDLRKDCAELPSRHKEKMKKVSCGIAALVSESGLQRLPQFTPAPIPRYFSSLPLPFPTNLPVHIHASFVLASDRASLSLGGSMQEDGAKWNLWLLSYAVPRLYLSFLEDLGRQTLWVHDPFKFWPQGCPPKGNFSESVYASFWTMLRESSLEIFPITRQIRAAQLGQRTPPELTRIDEAMFDFLPEDKSAALREILEYYFPMLVRAPKILWNELEQRKGLDSVTPRRLRELFQDVDASQHLEVTEGSMVLESVLDWIGPNLDEDFTELDGCRILPLADGTLGTLRLANHSEKADQYFLAKKEELELFDFALGRLSSKKCGKAFIKAIMDHKKFNITRLDLSNIGTLLKTKKFGTELPTQLEDMWLEKFWAYYRRAEDSASSVETPPLTSSRDICSCPIFKATYRDVQVYIEPERLDNLPSVIEPAEPEHRSLCRMFPGIYVFNPKYLPRRLTKEETSLESQTSFVRFITAISGLAKSESMELDLYVKKYLGTDEIELLKKLTISYVSANTPLKDLNMRSLLRLIPVWPSTESSSLINVAAALATQYPHLLLPWMRQYDQFISPETFAVHGPVLKALGVNQVSMSDILSAYILPNLPNELPDIHTYHLFIDTVSKDPNWRSFLNLLRPSKMAPNRAKKLGIPYELYDHLDTVFMSAFRDEQDDKFLLKELEIYREFWLALGLRHRNPGSGQFIPSHYKACLTSMGNRLRNCQDQSLYSAIVADAKAVLLPLTTASTALGQLSDSDWLDVGIKATFPVKVAFEDQPSHRRAVMTAVATRVPLLPLLNINRIQDLSVCWSQTPFPAVAPTVTTLNKMDGSGKPSTNMVWAHLVHMASSLQGLAEGTVREFLSDIYDTYAYLQANLDNSRQSFASFRGKKVWFNLELTDTGLVRKTDLEGCQCSIENLILESSSDTANLQSVRQGLIRFEPLLRALGCKSIVYPSIVTEHTQSTKKISASLSQLRKDGLLLDLTLEAEGGTVRAHKVVMAAASGFFARQFKEHWSNQDTILLPQYSLATITTLVDFAYADVFNWTSMQLRDGDRDKVKVIADKLDELLDLLEAANYFLFVPDLTAEVEEQILVLARLYIREHNVLGVRDRAREANAKRVERYCQKFYDNNKEAVDLAMSTGSAGE